MENELSLTNRTKPVFADDFARHRQSLGENVRGARILVVGGAGSIGGTVVRLLFDLEPAALHVVDVNENALADLVRYLRSSRGYTTEDFRTFCFDPLHVDGSAFVNECGPYDAILNFAAVKHVRSEKDPFTLARMLDVNLRLISSLAEWRETCGARTLFSVSTDKAANPANIMGASKRVMEMIGFTNAAGHFSSARFANVAFSNGSLLHAFWDRIAMRQPISAPRNIERFFITHHEAALLCLLGAFVAPKGTVLIPAVPGEIQLTSFVNVARNVLASKGYEPLECETEEEARQAKPRDGLWPCYFFDSDTSGEKPYEEFIGEGEQLGASLFQEIALIDKSTETHSDQLQAVLDLDPVNVSKQDVVSLLSSVVPGFGHVETGRNLDQRM